MKFSILILATIFVSGCAIPTSQQNCCECSADACGETACCNSAVSEMPNDLRQTAPANQVVVPPVASKWDEIAPADHRLEALEEDLRKLEIQRQYERAHQMQLEQNLESMSVRVARLNDDVDHWREQVVRLEDEAITQHTLDLESLDRLSTLVEQVSVSEGGD